MLATSISIIIWLSTLFWQDATAELNIPKTEQPIVVELFTSQGCSSCPPADKFLAELATEHKNEVLPLSFHVDYWNELGWPDPFSNPKFSIRQYIYTQGNRTYTPQMFIDGYLESPGTRKYKVFKNIKKAAQTKFTIPIKISPIKDTNKLRVDIKEPTNQSPTPPTTADIILIRFDQHHQTQIKQGENAGRTISNHNVVKSIDIIGRWLNKPLNFQIEKGQSGEGLAILLQQPNQGRIISANYHNYNKPQSP